jgi:predicted kinase
MERGEAAIRGGRMVILDATFLEAARREQAAAVARHCGVPLVLVETECDEDVVADRLAARQARGESRSDATIDTYRRQRAAHRESPPTVPDGTIEITIDTTPSGPASLDPAFLALLDARVVQARISDDGAPVGEGREQT